MDNELMGNGDGEKDRGKDQKNNQKSEETYRVTVSKKVDKEIDELVTKVNDGFSGGKVNRPQLVNWILLRFCDGFADADLKAIRADHFDEISLLDSILRQAKETGKVPSEFRALLQKHMGLEEAPKKTKPKVDKELHQ